MSATRFERDIERCGSGFATALFRVTQCFDFRVSFAGAPMPAASDDLAALDQQRADHGIGRSRAVTAPG